MSKINFKLISISVILSEIRCRIYGTRRLKGGPFLPSYSSWKVDYLSLPDLITLTLQVNRSITPTFSRAVGDPSAVSSPRFLPSLINVYVHASVAIFVTVLSNSTVGSWHCKLYIARGMIVTSFHTSTFVQSFQFSFFFFLVRLIKQEE